MTALPWASRTSRKSAACCGNASGGACGCGGTCDCSQGGVCRTDGFKRPRFFAGQLLTAEDLDLIDAYVVGKNRLHNRFLFGDGVVCGLTVTCHPCGGGVVRIAPGYALDCCGNDIYVPCPEEVDINKLARDLRIRKLAGYDCGDPCPERTSGGPHPVGREPNSTGKGGPEQSSEGAGGENGKNAKKGEGEEKRRSRYCLYIRYHEASTDPVAPYASDEPCGPADCQASRICEGYAFEVRCSEGCDRPETILDHLCRCVGDPKEAAWIMHRVRVASLYSAETAPAVARLPEAIKLEQRAVNAASESISILRSLIEQAAPDEISTRRAIAHLLRAAVTVARYRALEEGQRQELGETAQQIADISAAVRDTHNQLRGMIENNISDAQSKDYASAVLDQSAYYTSEDRSAQDFVGTEARLFVNGAVASKPVAQTFTRDMAALKDWLLQRLERSTTQTSCDLLQRVRRVAVPDATTDLETTLRQQHRLSTTLSYALLEYLKDCFCLALNPSCPPCDDPAVLLACVTVEDCDVVDICNLDRRFVLSPMAMRYWIPPLSWLGWLFETVCCEVDLSPPPKDPGTVEQQPDPANNFLVASAPLQPEFAAAPARAANLLESVGISSRDASATVTSLASLLGLARTAAGGEEATRLLRMMSAEVVSAVRQLGRA
ncbi:MAG: hypothetical protein U1E38_06155 [Rhodospirillales bacterium]